MKTVRYRCTLCSDETCPEFEDFVRGVAAAAWHDVADPLVDWPTMQAAAVSWLSRRDGRCPFHASLLGALAIDAMKRGIVIHRAVAR